MRTLDKLACGYMGMHEGNKKTDGREGVDGKRCTNTVGKGELACVYYCAGAEIISASTLYCQ